jgi:hypothetical protein
MIDKIKHKEVFIWLNESIFINVGCGKKFNNLEIILFFEMNKLLFRSGLLKLVFYRQRLLARSRFFYNFVVIVLPVSQNR